MAEGKLLSRNVKWRWTEILLDGTLSRLVHTRQSPKIPAKILADFVSCE